MVRHSDGVTVARSVVTGVACVAALFAASAPADAAKARHYPPKVQKAFMDSCVDSLNGIPQARKLCRLSLRCVERNVTLKELANESGSRKVRARVLRISRNCGERAVGQA